MGFPFAAVTASRARPLGGGGASPTLISDTFTDTNGVSLDAHDPEVGGPWVEVSGDFDIQSNYGNATGATPADPGFVATIDAGEADYTLDGVLRIAGAGVIAAAFAVRYGVDGKFYHVKITQLANAFQIVEWDGAAFTTRANVAVTIAADTDYAIHISVSGPTITATIDGGNEISYGSATVNQTATKIGLQASFNGVRYNDLVVERI